MLKLGFKKFNIILSILISLFCVTNCGFHFNGKYELPAYLHQLVIYPLDDIKADFYVQLKNVLETHGVTVLNINAIQNLPLNNNISILHIPIPVIKEKIQGYNSQGQITNNIIIASCNFKLFDHANNLLQKNIIYRNRTYALNNTQLLSNLSERQLIIQELQLEIINELLKQLSVAVKLPKNK